MVWVTRAQENLPLEVMAQYPVKAGGKMVWDELGGLQNPASQRAYPELMRRIVAGVEGEGQERLMTCLTNQLTWSPENVAELYRCRWEIEGFFKPIKQTLQLADFLGTSERGAVADWDGAVDLPTPALPGLALGLGASLQPVIGVGAHGIMA